MTDDPRAWLVPAQWWARHPATWEAVDRDCSIVGAGPTRQAALASLRGQRDLYLAACTRDGSSPHRPVPRSWSLSVRARMVVSSLVRAGAR